MISPSLGHRVHFSFVLREARRSNLMMAVEQSTLPCRAILFLLVLFGIPGALRSATLDESAVKLAGEIGATLPSGAQASCEFLNISSVSAEDASRAEQSFREALRSACVPSSASDTSAIDITVTLSENWKEFVWTAQIRTSNGTLVLLETSPRVPNSHDAPGEMQMSLRAAKIWEGPQRILNFASLQLPSGQQELWLLTEEGVVLRQAGGRAISQLQLPRALPPSRDPVGEFTRNDKDMLATFSGKICTISADAFSVTGCQPGPPPVILMYPPVRPWGSQSTYVEGSCPFVHPILGSGRSDYTERDFVQLFEATGLRTSSAGTSISAPIFFGGPVMSISDTISGAGNLGIVVHNLESGNYEAYQIVISCAN
ncbi:MAG TPA: hypothetical protein VNY09_03515 [Candidatus Sulfotelmatobacter sp.]|nr:hypothetical protein [Candidatus Sulfotelmatobacter sp.]